MKLVVLPLFQGVVVRNILRTNFLEILLKDKDIRIIFLVRNLEKKIFLEKDFKGDQISYEIVPEYKAPTLNTFFNFLKFNLLKTKRMDIRRKILLEENKNIFSFFFKYIFNRLFSFRFSRAFFRYIDFVFVKDTNYLDILEKHKPDLVVSAHPFGDEESSLIRQAKKRKIKTVAIINSWDKLTSRGIIRILPDKMIVPNLITKREAIKHADMKEENIEVTGMPYFDMFFNNDLRSKDWFYEKFNIDTNKKIVLICPTGQFYSDLDVDLINRISSLIEKHNIKNDCQIIVRFPPNDIVDTTNIINKEKIIFYQPGIRFSAKRGIDWDMSDEDNQLLLDMLNCSSVIVCPPSSISIDASILNKPIINVKFGSSSKYSNNNIDLYYESDHYGHILKHNGIKLVENDKELAFWIDEFIDKPLLLEEGRKKIVMEQCRYLDGLSALRVANFITGFLNNFVNKTNIVFVCYHYIKRKDIFKRIWGHDFKLFKKHIKFFKKNYPPVSISQLEDALKGKIVLPPKCSVITFDDGLKEHLKMGKYLAKNNISALFNICGDVVLLGEPVIAQVVHFSTAYYGVKRFAQMIGSYITDVSLNRQYKEIIKDIKITNTMIIHSRIKDFFNKNNNHNEILKVVREFWKKELKRDVPDIFERVFLGQEDVKKLISLRHEIGLHTASHTSFRYLKNNLEVFDKEIKSPKENLEKLLDYKIRCFAYPFGKKEDIFSSEYSYFRQFSDIGIGFVFTTYYDNIPLLRLDNIGRYLTQSNDSTKDLELNMWPYEISYNNK